MAAEIIQEESSVQQARAWFLIRQKVVQERKNVFSKTGPLLLLKGLAWIQPRVQAWAQNHRQLGDPPSRPSCRR